MQNIKVNLIIMQLHRIKQKYVGGEDHLPSSPKNLDSSSSKS
jgi:hypothetical protein